MFTFYIASYILMYVKYLPEANIALHRDNNYANNETNQDL